MHLLLMISPGDRIHNPVKSDDLTSAEIRNTYDPVLQDVELKWMILNLCRVELNPNVTCMNNKDGKLQCWFGVLKQYNSVTFLADDEKTKYHRSYDPKLD